MTSQLKTIIDRLNETGEVTRNWCLQRFISRLGARIDDLKSMGWEFDTESRPTVKPDGSKGKDFVYKVVTKGSITPSTSPKSAPGSTKSPQDDPRQHQNVLSDYKGSLMQGKLI